MACKYWLKKISSNTVNKEELNIMRMEMVLIFNVQSLDIAPVWEETGYFNNDV